MLTIVGEGRQMLASVTIGGWLMMQNAEERQTSLLLMLTIDTG